MALSAAIGRCTNPRSREYANYGGRGIGVCERWRADVAAFVADMGRRPSPMHSIDRINVNGHYEPGNCRWATRAEQARNTRVAILVTIDGQTKSLSDWCDEFGVDRRAVDACRKRGMSAHDSIFAATSPRPPVVRGALYALADGSMLSLTQLAALAGVRLYTMSRRLRRGLTPDQAVGQLSARRSA